MNELDLLYNYGHLNPFNQQSSNLFKVPSKTNIFNKLGISKANIGGIANTGANLASGLMNPSGNQTGVGNVMQSVGSLASNIPGVGGIIGAGVNLLGGVVNAAFGSNINEDFVNQTRQNIEDQSNYISGATTNDQLLSDYFSHKDLALVNKKDVGSEGWFSNKVTDLTKELNRDVVAANSRARFSLGNTAFNIDRTNDMLALKNKAAYGGPIHIKKENRGKFTDYCGGKVTNECIQRGLNSSNPLTRQRANFARNSRGWSHGDGGPMSSNKDTITPMIAETVLDFIPIIGDVKGLTYDVYQGYKDEGLKGAAINAGLGLLGLVPFVGDGIKASVKVGKKANKLAKIVDKVVDYSKLTDKEWDDLYNKALKSGDKIELQRLRDAHFKVKAPNTKIVDNEGNVKPVYRGDKENYNVLRESHIDSEVGDMQGIYTTFDKKYAKQYGNVNSYYVNSEDPLYTNGRWTGVINEQVKNDILDNGYDLIINENFDNTPKILEPFIKKRTENILFDNTKIKSANSVTYDDAGDIIPLSKRDNFNSSDIRYGLIPIGLGGLGLSTLDSNQKAFGGNLDLLKTEASYLPFVGTTMDIYDFIEEPSLENVGWASASLLSDIFTRSAAKAAIKSAKLARNAAKTRRVFRDKNIKSALNYSNTNWKTNMQNTRRHSELEKQYIRNMQTNIGKGIGYYGSNVFLNTLQQSNEKAEGGLLDTNFSNGVTIIGNGGTHEENPMEGIQMGTDQNGIPNLVEEGEVIWNNYVFSNRLKPTKEMRKQYKYKDTTFANIAKDIQKESQERPNDPISKRGLDAAMFVLQQSQEEIRNNKQKGINNKFREGGELKPIFPKVGLNTPDRIEPFSGYGITFDGNLATQGEKDTYVKNFNKYNKAITDNTGIKDSPYRKAGLVAAGSAVISDLFSKPDYSIADMIQSVPIKPNLVSYTPIGQRLAYKPLDRDYYANKLDSQIAASRSAIRNMSGGNRAAAIAALASSDYNALNNLGNMYRQAEEYNRAQEERVANFNRQTDQTNSQMGLQTAMANQSALDRAQILRLEQMARVASARDAARKVYDARRSTNLNNFIQGLQNLGREDTYKSWLDVLANSGVLKMDTKGKYTGNIG